MTDKSSSPFTPGNPVPFELFVGRAEQILELMYYVEQSALGKQENIFLVGERGIGKTSISSFLRYWVQKEKDVIAVHVFLGGVSSLDELVRRIFEALLKATRGENWFEKIRGLFGDFIKDVDLFGVSIGFVPPKDNLQHLVRNFPQALQTFITKIKDDKKALLIVLDDLDSLTSTPEFAHWYKSFADEIATHYDEFPLTIMLVGLPTMMDSLAGLQPSLMRIFRVIELESLSKDEVSEFFKKAFDKANMEIEDKTLKTLVMFSSGLPVIMQEIGDATYMRDKDNKIDHDDALNGVLLAAKRIGRKYLDPQVYRALRSSSYHSILRKLGSRESPLNRSFTRRDVAAHLTDAEQKVLDNFLSQLRKIGIIEPEAGMARGTYRFANDIYPIYIWMEAKAFAEQNS